MIVSLVSPRGPGAGLAIPAASLAHPAGLCPAARALAILWLAGVLLHGRRRQFAVTEVAGGDAWQPAGPRRRRPDACADLLN